VSVEESLCVYAYGHLDVCSFSCLINSRRLRVRREMNPSSCNHEGQCVVVERVRSQCLSLSDTPLPCSIYLLASLTASRSKLI
jgi:hypothetical protein